MTEHDMAVAPTVSTWTYVPGLLDLVEGGIEPDDLASREFLAPQVRGSSLGGQAISAQERSTLTQLWDWLRGFRQDATLCDRAPIWVPIARVWAASKGTAEFKYSTAGEQEYLAEITVFSVFGFGGGSKRKLTTAVSWATGEPGAAYETRAYLTVRRYVRKNSKDSLLRVDIDCQGEVGEFRTRDMAQSEHPFPGTMPPQKQLMDAGYVISRIEHCSDRDDSTVLTLSDESLRSWKFELNVPVPGVDAKIKLGATCQHSRAFETKFTLPGGHNYAFCAPATEAPVAPICVALSD